MLLQNHTHLRVVNYLPLFSIIPGIFLSFMAVYDSLRHDCVSSESRFAVPQLCMLFAEDQICT